MQLLPAAAEAVAAAVILDCAYVVAVNYGNHTCVLAPAAPVVAGAVIADCDHAES